MAERQPTGGEWIELADRVEKVIQDLRGTGLSHWEDSLRFLVKDIHLEAGAAGEREVEAFRDPHWDRRAA